MRINSINLNTGNRPQQGGGRAVAPSGGNRQGRGLPGDRSGLSKEAQQAAGTQGKQGGGPQQLTQALTQGIGKVMQAQGSGDQNRSQQALQQLGQTYQQGQQSGQLEQVPPMIKQTAESLLGIGKQGEGQQAEKGGGCGGGCGGGGESGGAGEAGGASESGGAGGSEGAGEKNDMSEEVLKKLEQLLGKDKAEEAKEDGKVPEEVNVNIDGSKQDGKAGDKDAKGDKVAEAGKDKKVDGPSKGDKSKSADKPKKAKTAKKAAPKKSKAPKKSGGGKKKKAA